MKDLKTNSEVSVEVAKDGIIRYVSAFILAKIATGEFEIEQYMVSLGKGKPKVIFPFTAIHAPVLAHTARPSGF